MKGTTLGALLIAAAAAAAQEKPKPAKGGASEGIVAGALGKELDACVRGIDVEQGGFCGVVLVARQGKVLLERGYGVADAAAEKPMPADALYDWASVSNPVRGLGFPPGCSELSTDERSAHLPSRGTP